jgi:hypothetical protein
MFDTIRCNYTVYLPIETFQQLKQNENLHVKIEERFDSATGEITFSADILNHGIHFIKYYSNSCRLIFETSIPKYLYGHNVHAITESDLPLFYSKVQADLENLLGITIDLEQVTVTGLHVCYNFNVSGTGYSVQQWLKYISEQEIPYKPIQQVNMYKGRISGVIFKSNPNSNYRVTFYDKYSEMYYRKDKTSRLAKNILRVEIKTSKHERRNFGNKLSQLLTQDFFMYLMEKYQIEEMVQNNQVNQETDQIPYVYLIDEKGYKIYQLERIAGHMRLVNDLDELAKTFYEKKTFENRQKDLKDFHQAIMEQPKQRKILKVQL